jgi:hypothetical protein
VRRVRGLLSAAVVLTALLWPGTAAAEPAATDDPATHGLKRTPLDLGGADSLAPGTIDGASICQRYYILSYRTGTYVAEEQGYTGSSHNMLRARTPDGALGTWEQFSICAWNNRSDIIFIQASSGYLATAEYGYSGNNKGMLRGRGEWPADWEIFEVWSDGGRFFLRNQATKGWVSVRVDVSNMLRGNATAAGPWEQLGFRRVAG